MSKLSFSLCIALAVSCAQALAETVLPMNGQTSQQMQKDIDACHDEALGQSDPNAKPAEPDPPGRQHDEFYEGGDDPTKPAYIACLKKNGYQVNP